jgi:AraC-like DNA-binding protein
VIIKSFQPKFIRISLSKNRIMEFMFYQVAISRYNIGERLPYSKSELYEFHFVKNGSKKVGINRKIFYAGKGDIFFIKPGDFHNESTLSDNTSYYFLGFTKNTISTKNILKPSLRIGNRAQILENLSSYPSCIMQSSPKMRKNIEAVFRALNKKDKPTGRITKCLTNIIIELSALLQKSISRTHGIPAGYHVPEGRIKDVIKNAIKYLKTNFSETVDIKKLAFDMHLSYGYFVRIFKKHLGVSPKAFQLEERLKAAAGLLKKTDMKVDEVLERSGFRNRSQFFNLFTEKYGLSPYSFRKYKKASK